MTLYRYKAVSSTGGDGVVHAGEIAAESPAALRASLRRIGLQVIDARPVRRDVGDAGRGALTPLREAWARHLRTRRVADKAEVFDSLATMLEAGLPLAEAMGAMSGPGSVSARHTMLVAVRERIRAGDTLDAAMGAQSSWFDASEVAMVRAARATGDLSPVLRSLSERHERAGSLSSRIVAVLIYPAAVLGVGIGVVVFMSVRTLPELTSVLTDAGVQAPALTRAIIAVGAGLRAWGLPLLGAIVLAVVFSLLARPLLNRVGVRVPPWVRAMTPRFIRSAKLACALAGLAELTRTGVPLVDALRIAAPTVGGSLGVALAAAARDIERGRTLADSLGDPHWFSTECRRLIAIGETAGELPITLERLAARSHRSATRTIDRLAALIEPAVILVLAAMVGIVVMGAVLPLVRLQEVIG